MSSENFRVAEFSAGNNSLARGIKDLASFHRMMSNGIVRVAEWLDA